jgi:Holliday junction resolvase RusA-like endonuclease
MSAAIYFVVPGQPVGKGRPRASTRGGFVRMYTDAKTLSYEAAIAHQATFAMSMWSVAFYGIPPSWPKHKQMLALNNALIPGKPDLDNVAKAVLDALNGVVYQDDKQVVKLVAEKRYSYDPRIEVYAHEVCQ